LIESTIEPLPPMQAHVIALRDVEGWKAEEVCALLDVSAAVNESCSIVRDRRCARLSSSIWTRRARPGYPLSTRSRGRSHPSVPLPPRRGRIAEPRRRPGRLRGCSSRSFAALLRAAISFRVRPSSSSLAQTGAGSSLSSRRLQGGARRRSSPPGSSSTAGRDRSPGSRSIPGTTIRSGSGRTSSRRSARSSPTSAPRPSCCSRLRERRCSSASCRR
jgi:hypothetical protein